VVSSSKTTSDDNNPVLNAITLEIEKAASMANFLHKMFAEIETGLFGNNTASASLMNDIKELIAGIVPWSWNKRWNHGQSGTKQSKGVFGGIGAPNAISEELRTANPCTNILDIANDYRALLFPDCVFERVQTIHCA